MSPIQTIEYNPEIESILVLDPPFLLIKGKKSNPMLFLFFAFFMIPHLDEELAQQVKIFSEKYRKEIEEYMRKREAKKE